VVYIQSLSPKKLCAVSFGVNELALSNKSPGVGSGTEESRYLLLCEEWQASDTLLLQHSARISLKNPTAAATPIRFAIIIGTIGDRIWLTLIMRH